MRRLWQRLRISQPGRFPPAPNTPDEDLESGSEAAERQGRWEHGDARPRAGRRENTARRSPPTLAEWYEAYRSLEPPDLGTARFSVVCPTSQTPPRLLRECVQSVVDQTYTSWELVLVGHGPPNEDSRVAMTELETLDRRIRLVRLDASRDIADAANAGAEAATGDYLVFLDPDDVLSPTALAWLSTCAPGSDLIYSDGDRVDVSGKHHDAFHKPDWSPRLLLGINYVNHLRSVRTTLFREVGGFRNGLEGMHDHDLVLRLAELPMTVAHLPNLLYARRDPKGLDSHDSEGIRVDEPGLAVIADVISRRGLNAHARSVTNSPRGFRIIFDAEPEPPSVKIVMPTRDRAAMLRTAVDGVLNRTDGVKTHLVIVDNGSRERDALDLLAELSIRPDVTVHTIDEPFNFSRLCNQGVAIGPDAPLLLLLNNDIEILHHHWLLQLTGWLRDPEVAGAGPTLLFPDGSIQHAGVILGWKRAAGHYARNQPNRPRASSLHDQAREVSCLTAACLLIRSADYHAAGGMNEDFPVDFGDVDFCLRLARATGGTFMYDPTYPLTHLESATRKGIDAESSRASALLHDLWGPQLQAHTDPFYNPHLSYQRHRVVRGHIPDDPAERLDRVRPRFTVPRSH